MNQASQLVAHFVQLARGEKNQIFVLGPVFALRDQVLERLDDVGEAPESREALRGGAFLPGRGAVQERSVDVKVFVANSVIHVVLLKVSSGAAQPPGPRAPLVVSLVAKAMSNAATITLNAGNPCQ